FQLFAKEGYEKHTKNWEVQYQKLSEKIEALLPNALTAGLSSAFSEKKKVEIKEYKKLEASFIKAIWSLVGVSLIPFAVGIYSFNHNKSLDQVLFDMPRLVLS